jgi:SpoVK/Ycf46/Vps4 family AAA+-type ATPase
MDQTLRRRFTATVQLPLPDQDERRQILANLLGKSALDPDVDIDEICTCLAGGLEGMSPRDLQSFLHGAEERAVKRAGTSSDTVLVREDLLAEMAEMQERRHGFAE